MRTTAFDDSQRPSASNSAKFEIIERDFKREADSSLTIAKADLLITDEARGKPTIAITLFAVSLARRWDSTASTDAVLLGRMDA